MNDISRGLHHLTKAIKFLSLTANNEIKPDYYNASNITKEVNRLILMEKRLLRFEQKYLIKEER